MLTKLERRAEVYEPCVDVPFMSKLEVLFSELPEARRLYRDIMESRGVNNFGLLNDMVADVVGTWEFRERGVSLIPTIALGEAIRDADICQQVQ